MSAANPGFGGRPFIALMLPELTGCQTVQQNSTCRLTEPGCPFSDMPTGMQSYLCMYSQGAQLLGCALEEHRCLLPGFLPALLPIGGADQRLPLRRPILGHFPLGGSGVAVILKAQDRPMGKQQECV